MFRCLIVAIIFFVTEGIVIAQNKTELANSAKEIIDTYQKLNLFTPTQSKAIGNLDFNHQKFDIDKTVLLSLEATKTDKLILQIPLDGEVRDVLINASDILAYNYKLTTDKGEINTDHNRVKTFRGVDLKSNFPTAVTISQGEIYIMMTTLNGNYEISPSISDESYIGHYVKNRKDLPHWSCETDDEAKVIRSNNGDSRAGDCLELYLECDFAAYQDNGSDVLATEAWVINMMNAVSILYNEINIPIVVSEIFVWTSTDPYATESTLGEIIDEFKNEIQDGYNGRVAKLLSTRPVGGGLADGIGGVCGTYDDFPGPYAISTNLMTSYDAFPAYSYNIYVITHEIGHVLGARHTHACVWNGDNTQIDDCGNVIANDAGDTPEGLSCFDELNPILPTDGTIMSKCNDLPAVGIDFSSGFHSQVAAVLTDNYNNAECFTGTICSTITPSNDDCIGAIEITGSNICMPEIYDNILATPSVGSPDFGCGNVGTIDDVWFRVLVPSSGNISIETTDEGSLTNTIMQVYSGDCANLVRLDCDDNSGVGNHAQISLTGLTAGTYVYIRIIDSESDEEGTFGLCAYDASLPCHPDFDNLIDIYNDANGANWTDNNGWIDGANGTDCDICTWTGVVCDGFGRVKELNLVGNNLSGTLSSSIANITTLKRINIWNHTLSGTIPTGITNLPNLTYLDLSNGDFSGSIPDFDSNILNTIYLENNNLSGELPASIGNMDAINIFWAKNNSLTGCFPDTYINLCSIQSVQLQDNVNLPNGGMFSYLCDSGFGMDLDNDTFCAGNDIDEDCDDTRDDVNPNAIEVCDGIDNNCDGAVDENFVETNVWNGGSGQWSQASNWSLGHVPLPCEDVIINSGLAIVDANYDAVARSLTINGSSEVELFGNLMIQGSDGSSLLSNGVSILDIKSSGNLMINSLQGVAALVQGIVLNDGAVIVAHPIGLHHIEVVGAGVWTNMSGSSLQLSLF